MHGFKNTKASTPVQILAVVDPQVSFGCIVSDAGITADASGRKIVKAGTPLVGDLTKRETAFTKVVLSSTEASVVGVLLHDVDVTDGAENGTCLVFGWVNKDRIDATTLTLWNEATTAALKNRVTMIK